LEGLTFNWGNFHLGDKRPRRIILNGNKLEHFKRPKDFYQKGQVLGRKKNTFGIDTRKALLLLGASPLGGPGGYFRSFQLLPH